MDQETKRALGHFINQKTEIELDQLEINPPSTNEDEFYVRTPGNSLGIEMPNDRFTTTNPGGYHTLEEGLLTLLGKEPTLRDSFSQTKTYRGQFETHGQRVSPDGTVDERSITKAQRDAVIDGMNQYRSGAVMTDDGGLGEGWHFKHDFSLISSYKNRDSDLFERQMEGKYARSTAMTYLSPEGCIEHLLKIAEDENSTDQATITFKTAHPDHPGQELSVQIPLKDMNTGLWEGIKILMEKGEATLSIVIETPDGQDREYGFDYDRNHIKNYRNGFEDTIPESVIKAAKYFSEQQGKPLTVLPFIDARDAAGNKNDLAALGDHVQDIEYMFIDDDGNIVSLAVPHLDSDAVYVRDPNNDDPSYNVYHGGKVVDPREAGVAPHIDNPINTEKTKEEPRRSQEGSEDIPYTTYDPHEELLIYHPGDPFEENPLAGELQTLLSKWAKHENIENDSISEKDPDNIYGPKTKALWLQYEKNVEMPEDGIVTRGRLDSLRRHIKELELDPPNPQTGQDTNQTKIVSGLHTGSNL